MVCLDSTDRPPPPLRKGAEMLFMYVFGAICLLCLLGEAAVTMGLRKLVAFIVLCIVGSLLVRFSEWLDTRKKHKSKK